MESDIERDLQKKMVFLGGPRQVGKTTLAKRILANRGLPAEECYFSWDVKKHRSLILREELPTRYPLLVLDEIHKFARWRSLVKGFFDLYGKKCSLLITGSARLDYYRKGGDSLQGRYHYYRMHPFSLPELNTLKKKTTPLDKLFRLGGFPEPLLTQMEIQWRRWQRERMDRILDVDLRDLEQVREISLIELLLDVLPTKVGSPLSINSLREDLEVNHQTIARWLEILDRLYVTFRISPWGTHQVRAVKKEQKLYMRDWSLIEDPAIRFENMIACHLLKYCDYVQDTQGYRMELRYLRDTDGREVDFIVVRDRKPLFAVEAKLSDTNRSSHLKYFIHRTPIPKFYQVYLKGPTRFGNPGVDGEVLAFGTLCDELGLV